MNVEYAEKQFTVVKEKKVARQADLQLSFCFLQLWCTVLRPTVNTTFMFPG